MNRLTVLKGFFAFFALTIAGRAVQLQVFKDERLERLAQRQFSSRITQLPRRGFIFDRNGEGLAISLKVHSIFLRPELLRKETTAKERTRILFNLAKVLKMPPGTLAAKIKSDKGFVWVKRQLSDQEERQIRDLGLLEFGDGIGLAEETKRFYPNRELGSHVLGAVNVDGQGLEGLELLYDGILGGEQVRVSSNKDARGRKIFRDSQGFLAFNDGQSLILTIDKAVQYEAEKALRNAVDEHQAKAGTVIVAEVETGDILAMANYPTYNPNSPKNVPVDHRRNRAITDTYEPGSTFKPFLVAMALEKGRTPKSQIYCEKGSFKVGDRRISEATANEKFEWLNLGEILKYSSNIGSAKLALEMGAGNMSQLMSRLGVGNRTEIDLPGEVGGMVDTKELKSPVRLANVGFGHGFTVTPLQMLSYYLSIASGGRWVQPKLVKAILSEDPDSLERGAIRYKLGHRFDNLKTRRVFSPTIAKQVTEMLETVVEEKGTGTRAQLAEWTVAGKTGTAQKIDTETHRYSRSKHISTFAGFAPSRNPKLVALVLLDEPQKKYLAGETAAPAFREVMRASLLRERVTPNVKHELATANRNSVDKLVKDEKSLKVSAVAKDIEIGRNDQAQIRLPNMTGMTVREVLKIVSREQLDFEIIGSGVLRDQIPAANQWLQPDAHVKLVFQRLE